MTTAYQDRFISCGDDGLTVRWYYPWGSKHISYSSIRSVERVATSALAGRGRIWGTANPRYWASLDPKRPTKSSAIILDLGRSVRPYLTPDAPDAFEAAIRSRLQALPSGESAGLAKRSPII